jgi:hypothetical protein
MYGARDIYRAFDADQPMKSEQAELQAFMLQYVRMRAAEKDSAFIPWLDWGDDGEKAPLDFTNVEECVATLPTLAEQEAADDSAFAASRCAFGFAHMTPELLNAIGKPLAGNPKYLCVWPPAPSGAKARQRALAVGRQYVGMAVDRTKKTFVTYRASDALATECDLLVRGKLRDHFALYFNDPVLKQLIIASNNRFTGAFTMPIGKHGVRIELTVPYLPHSLFEELKGTAKKRKKATTSTASSSATGDGDDDDDDDDAAEDDEAAVDDDAELDDTSALLVAGAKRVTTLSAGQVRLANLITTPTAAAATAVIAKPPPPALAAVVVAPPSVATPPAKRRRVLTLPSVGRRIDPNEPLTFENFIAHYMYKKTQPGFPTPEPPAPPGASLSTLIDANLGAISHFLSMIEYLEPAVFDAEALVEDVPSADSQLTKLKASYL